MEKVQIGSILFLALLIGYFVHRVNFWDPKNNCFKISFNDIPIARVFRRLGLTTHLTFAFWGLFDNYLWKWPIWQGWLVDVPIIDGCPTSSDGKQRRVVAGTKTTPGTGSYC